MLRVHTRYTSVAILLHWATAALILFDLGIGFFMEGFADPLKRISVLLHASAGITILVLTGLRVFWRLTHPPPPLDPSMTNPERLAAHIVHFILYVMMVAMPLIGWSIVSAHPPRPEGVTQLWGVIRLPQIGPISHMPEVRQKAAHDLFVTAHTLGGWTLVALLLLHVVGACKHQWFDGRSEFFRMGIGRGTAGSERR
jgi:cytochrome b561